MTWQCIFGTAGILARGLTVMVNKISNLLFGKENQMIKQYVKRPIIIRAVKWTGYNFDEIAEFVKEQPLTLYKNNFGLTKLLIETL